MSNKSINQFTSGSIADDSLVVIGDPNTGALSKTGYKAAKDYFQQGTSINTGSLALTSSLNSFTASYLVDSSSFNTRINNVFASESNYTLTSSFNTLSSSIAISIVNVFASESNYLPTSSFQTYTGSNTTIINNVFASESNYTLTSSFLSLSSSYVNTSGALDSRLTIVSQSTSIVVVGATATIPFDKAYSVMNYLLTGSNTLFVPNTASAVAYGSSVVTITGDGSHSASFSPIFNRLSTSSTYNTSSGVVNIVNAFFDGSFYYYEIANTTPADALLSTSDLIRYYDVKKSIISLTGSNVIYNMTDNSAVNVSATQIVSGSQPAYDTGSGAINFAGFRFLNMGAPSITTTNGATIVTVMELDNVGGFNVTMYSTASANYLVIDETRIVSVFFADTTGSMSYTSSVPGNRKGVFVLTYGTDRRLNFYYNATNIVSYIMPGAGSSEAIDKWGGDFTTEVPTGFMYHLSIFQHALSNNEIVSITNYLKMLHGIS